MSLRWSSEMALTTPGAMNILLLTNLEESNFGALSA